MGRTCAVFGCLSSSKYDKDRHFYRFPTNEQRRKQWIEAADRPELLEKDPNLLVSSYFICDLHFQDSDRLMKSLKRFAIPTLNLAVRENPNPSKYTQTDIREVEVKDSYTQANTLAVANLNNSRATQTTKQLAEDTPLKRKLQMELNQERKKLRILENERALSCVQNLQNHKNLSPELKKLIDLQMRLKNNNPGNRYDKEFKSFALRIYFASPLAYKVLGQTLSLPSEKTLQRMNIEIGTQLYSNVLECLNSKFKNMKDIDKCCIISADEIPLQRNLHYQINEDTILGFREINGSRTVEPASHALVVMAKGIFSNWKQHIGYSLLSENKNYKEINEWLNDIIVKMINIGFNVIAFICNQEPTFINLANERGISFEKPYFFIQSKDMLNKIFFIFDVPHLIKSIQNNLAKHEFGYLDSDGTVLKAKWEDIQQFYSQDSERSFRLAPKLSQLHVSPKQFEKLKIDTAIEVFSQKVAAAMSFSVECGLLDTSAIGTVKLIDLVDKTFKVLNSPAQNDRNKSKSATKLCGNEVLERFEFFLSTVTVHNKYGKDVTSLIDCLNGFKITLQSIKCLAADLLEAGSNFHFTKILHQDPSDYFFVCDKPTPIQFTRAFKKSFMADMLKRSKNSLSIDFDQLLMSTEDISDNLDGDPLNIEPQKNSSAITVGTADYRFDLPKRNPFRYVCGYLLHKCLQIHPCDKLIQYVERSNEEQQKLEHIFISNNSNIKGGKTLFINPSDNFVIYVKEMDNRIKQSFEQNVLDKVGNKLLDELNCFSFDESCECFPNEYLKKLLVRFRIFNIIKVNNQLFKDKSLNRDYFTICDLD